MPKPAKIPAYIAWLHEQPCLVTGRRGVEAHHLTRLTPMNRITRNDRYAVPLAPDVHNFGKFSVHRMGVTKFEAHWRTDLTAAAEWLFKQWEASNG